MCYNRKIIKNKLINKYYNNYFIKYFNIKKS